MASAAMQAAGPAAAPASGILLALTAFALFTVMDVSVKLLGGRYHVAQVIFLNSVFALLVVLLISACRGGFARLRTTQLPLHVTRWSLSFVGTIALFWCYPRMPLADLYAVVFAAPLLITALSAPLLGEQVGWRRWSAVGVGFLGVLVILNPGGGTVSAAAPVALIAAVFHALNMIVVRRLGARASEPVEIIGLVGNGLTLLAMGAAMPWLWRTPTLPDLGLAALAGSIAGSGFLLLAQAFRMAPAATVAPFQYSQMVYGILAGYLVFGDVPEPRMLLGAGIVIASGLYILGRERRRGGITTPLPAPGRAPAGPPPTPG